jgi:SIR2-like domain
VNIDRIFDTFRKPAAFLAGAGVSIDVPAGLPSARSLMERTLRHRLAAAIESDDELFHLIDRSTSFPTRPGEYLRFEIAMADVDRDVRASILGELQSGSPNANHYALAQLIDAGHIVITTNFDLHIETAYRHLYGRDCAVASRDDDFLTAAAARPGVLWKIHGSLSDPETLGATFTAILSQRSARDRWLRDVLEQFDLVVLGYSGSDDLDLIPPLAQTISKRALFWIDHASSETKVLTPEQWLAGSRARMHVDTVGLTRVMFSCHSPDRATRERDRAVVIKGSTTTLLHLILVKAGLTPVDPPASPPAASRPALQIADLDDYGAAHNLLTLLRYRRGAKGEEMQRRALRQLVVEGLREPAHHVGLLIELFNSPGARAALQSLGNLPPEWRPIANGDHAAFEARLDAMRGTLATDEEIRALRLRGCLATDRDKSEAEGWFEQSTRLAREAADPFAEFSTLATYRDFLYPSHFPMFWFRRAFPHSARFADLEQRTGFTPMVHADNLLRAIDYVQKLHVLPLETVLEQSAVSLETIFFQSIAARRYSVDVGDVRGELESTFVIAELTLVAALQEVELPGFGFWIEWQRVDVLAEALGMREAFGDRLTRMTSIPGPDDELSRDELVASMFS